MSLSKPKTLSTLVTAIVSVFLVAHPVTAQAPGTGSVQGTVKDSSGAVIPSAVVTLTLETGQRQTAVADAKGGFVFRHLAPGTYVVSVTAAGLEQQGTVLVALSVNQKANANVVMAVKTQVQEVTVTATGNNQVSTEASNNVSALVLKQEELDALPDDPDDLQADLEALAGPSAGPGGAQIFIDGFTGGRLPPKASIREIRINSNPFAAEYDKMGFGRIEIFTKPGTDKFHGQGYFGMSDSLWNSRNPFLTEEPPFKTELFGGNLSGPLGKRASFFLDLDRRQIDDDGIVNAQVPTSNFVSGQTLQTYYQTPQRRTTVSPRVDFQISSSNTLSMRYSYLTNDELLTGIGGYNLPATTIGDITLPSAGYRSSTGENLVQIVDTAVLNPRTINETRFQFARDSISEASQSTSPSINVANSFVAGGSGYSAVGYARSYDTQTQYEFQNYTSITARAHTIKFGGRIRADVLNDFAPKNFNGSYTFLGNSSGLSSLQQYLTTVQLLNAGYTSQQVTAMGYGPSQYSVNFGKPYIDISQVDFEPSIQDDWRLKPNFTLSFGLRFEAQTNIADKNDWAPRFAFAWSPDTKGAGGGRAKTVIRGGWGVFYDRFQIANVLNAYRYNGSDQQTYLVENPTSYGSLFDNTQALSSLTRNGSEQRYQIDRSLQAPMLMQTAIGIERQLFSHTTLAFNFIDSRGVHELRTADINAPLPGTYTYSGVGTISTNSGIRPFGDIGDIYDYQSTGIYKQIQAMVSVNTAVGKWANIFARYAHGNAHSDTDGITTMPANPYNFATDWGRSSLDIANLLFIGGSISLPKGVRLSPFMIARSGTPYNITTGTDIYGTGQGASSARPSLVNGPGANIVDTPFGYLDTIPQPGQTIIARNSATGPGFLELNLRMSKTWAFGTTKFEGPSGGSTARQGGGPPGGGPGRQGGGPGGGGPGGGGPGGGGPPPGMGGESSQHRYNLTLSISARNALNHENEASPVGVVTSPYFLESTSIAGGFGPESVASNQRRIDLQLRFTF